MYEKFRGQRTKHAPIWAHLLSRCATHLKRTYLLQGKHNKDWARTKYLWLTMGQNWLPGGRLNIKIFYQYREPMLKVRRSHNRLIFNMVIHIPGKDGLHTATGPWSPVTNISVIIVISQLKHYHQNILGIFRDDPVIIPHLGVISRVLGPWG